MIIAVLRRFAASRRSAVAIIFAVSLLPLMMLVGIAIDFTFLSQARTQATFAAQAAAVHAVRIADSTFALEMAHNCTGCSDAVPTAHAKAAANNAGDAWFSDVLGNLSFATISSAPYTNTTSTNDTASPPNFTATVTYSFKYPPIFDPLFGNPTTTWTYSSGATATSQFAYAQILMMLDTSNSMLIGATSQDIKTMELGSVCPVQGYILGADSGNTTTGLTALNFGLFDPSPDPNDGSIVDVDLTQVSTYNAQSPTDINSLCKSVSNTVNGVTTTTNYGIGSANLAAYGNKYLGGTAASTTQSSFSPPNACALACHNTTTKVNGYYGDLYGLARREGVTLRLDVLFSATEQVIRDMINDEATPNQFSLGVYQFNADVLPIVTGSTGSNAQGAPPEATTDLSSALTAVDAVDYKQTPTETAIPLLQNNTTTYSKAHLAASPEVTNEGSDTNLALSLSDLQAGTLPTGNQNALTASGQGGTISTPQKFMFIVTDGMSDTSSSNGASESGQVAGEMTRPSLEAAGTGTCSGLKKLGYTIYILYVTYEPLDDYAYYNPISDIGTGVNAATVADHPSDSNASAQTLSEVSTIPVTTLDVNGNPSRYINSPDGQALVACAGSEANVYTASDGPGIQAALAKMLKSALASTTRLTN